MYFGQTQYKFLQTTNEHGALIDDDDLEYGDEQEEEGPAKSLWQKTQESASLFSCFKCCRRRARDEDDEDEVEETVIIDDSQLLDNSALIDLAEKH